jgi:glutamine synthetase
MLAVDEFAAQVLADCAANGIPIGQLHAEYGLAQMELSIGVADPVTAADRQMLARQTIHAAARAHGLRASFAPLVALEAPGNGWHIHSSVSRDGRNLLAGGDGPEGMTPEGAAYVAGVLRELPAVAGVAAPSTPSLLRRRPGYFASAFAFWGVQNREAALRFVPAGAFVPESVANVELKASDASGNPYLSLAAVISAGLAGIADGLTLPEPIQDEPGGWEQAERDRRGVRLLPATPAEAIDAVAGSAAVLAAFGDDLLGAWLAVRRGDANAAEGVSPEDLVAQYRWRY